MNTTLEKYPISEVSRITGVNSITLRAWERRYGLIEPIRTPSGHRLYTKEHIDRIIQAKALNDTGIPISQVKPLLNTPQTSQVNLLGSAENLINQLEAAAIGQRLPQSYQLLMQLATDYSLCNQWIMIQTLQKVLEPNPLAWHFLHQLIHDFTLARIVNNERLLGKTPPQVAVFNLSNNPLAQIYLRLHLSMQGHSSQVFTLEEAVSLAVRLPKTQTSLVLFLEHSNELETLINTLEHLQLATPKTLQTQDAAKWLCENLF